MAASSHQDWDQPLTTQQIRQRSNDWNLAADAGLLATLEAFSDRLCSRAASLRSEVTGLLDQTAAAGARLETAAAQLMLVSSARFVESRVYDEEVQPPPPPADQLLEAPSKEALQRQAEAYQREALALGAKLIEEAYDKVEMSDSDSGGKGSDSLPPVLEPRDPYLHRLLPHVIGSRQFADDDSVGLQLTGPADTDTEDDVSHHQELAAENGDADGEGGDDEEERGPSPDLFAVRAPSLAGRDGEADTPRRPPATEASPPSDDQVTSDLTREGRRHSRPGQPEPGDLFGGVSDVSSDEAGDDQLFGRPGGTAAADLWSARPPPDRDNDRLNSDLSDSDVPEPQPEVKTRTAQSPIERKLPPGAVAMFGGLDPFSAAGGGRRASQRRGSGGSSEDGQGPLPAPRRTSGPRLPSQPINTDRSSLLLSDDDEDLFAPRPGRVSGRGQQPRSGQMNGAQPSEVAGRRRPAAALFSSSDDDMFHPASSAANSRGAPAPAPAHAAPAAPAVAQHAAPATAPSEARGLFDSDSDDDIFTFAPAARQTAAAAAAAGSGSKSSAPPDPRPAAGPAAAAPTDTRDASSAARSSAAAAARSKSEAPSGVSDGGPVMDSLPSEERHPSDAAVKQQQRSPEKQTGPSLFSSSSEEDLFAAAAVAKGREKTGSALEKVQGSAAVQAVASVSAAAAKTAGADVGNVRAMSAAAPVLETGSKSAARDGTGASAAPSVSERRPQKRAEKPAAAQSSLFSSSSDEDLFAAARRPPLAAHDTAAGPASPASDAEPAAPARRPAGHGTAESATPEEPQPAAAREEPTAASAAGSAAPNQARPPAPGLFHSDSDEEDLFHPAARGRVPRAAAAAAQTEVARVEPVVNTEIAGHTAADAEGERSAEGVEVASKESRAAASPAAQAPEEAVVRRGGRPLSALAASIEQQLGRSAGRRRPGPAGGVALFGGVLPPGLPSSRASDADGPLSSRASDADSRPRPPTKPRPVSMPPRPVPFTQRDDVTQPDDVTGGSFESAGVPETLPSLTKERARGPVKRRPSRRRPAAGLQSVLPAAGLQGAAVHPASQRSAAEPETDTSSPPAGDRTPVSRILESAPDTPAAAERGADSISRSPESSSAVVCETPADVAGKVPVFSALTGGVPAETRQAEPGADPGRVELSSAEAVTSSSVPRSSPQRSARGGGEPGSATAAQSAAPRASGSAPSPAQAAQSPGRAVPSLFDSDSDEDLFHPPSQPPPPLPTVRPGAAQADAAAETKYAVRESAGAETGGAESSPGVSVAEEPAPGTAGDAEEGVARGGDASEDSGGRKDVRLPRVPSDLSDIPDDALESEHEEDGMGEEQGDRHAEENDLAGGVKPLAAARETPAESAPRPAGGGPSAAETQEGVATPGVASRPGQPPPAGPAAAPQDSQEKSETAADDGDLFAMPRTSPAQGFGTVQSSSPAEIGEAVSGTTASPPPPAASPPAGSLSSASSPSSPSAAAPPRSAASLFDSSDDEDLFHPSLTRAVPPQGSVGRAGAGSHFPQQPKTAAPPDGGSETPPEAHAEEGALARDEDGGDGSRRETSEESLTETGGSVGDVARRRGLLDAETDRPAQQTNAEAAPATSSERSGSVPVPDSDTGSRETPLSGGARDVRAGLRDEASIPPLEEDAREKTPSAGPSFESTADRGKSPAVSVKPRPSLFDSDSDEDLFLAASSARQARVKPEPAQSAAVKQETAAAVKQEAAAAVKQEAAAAAGGLSPAAGTGLSAAGKPAAEPSSETTTSVETSAGVVKRNEAAAVSEEGGSRRSPEASEVNVPEQADSSRAPRQQQRPPRASKGLFSSDSEDDDLFAAAKRRPKAPAAAAVLSKPSSGNNANKEGDQFRAPSQPKAAVPHALSRDNSDEDLFGAVKSQRKAFSKVTPVAKPVPAKLSDGKDLFAAPTNKPKSTTIAPPPTSKQPPFSLGDEDEDLFGSSRNQPKPSGAAATKPAPPSLSDGEEDLFPAPRPALPAVAQSPGAPAPQRRAAAGSTAPRPAADSEDEDDLFGSARNAPRPADWETQAAAAAPKSSSAPPPSTSSTAAPRASAAAALKSSTSSAAAPRASAASGRSSVQSPVGDGGGAGRARSLFSDEDEDEALFGGARPRPAATRSYAPPLGQDGKKRATAATASRKQQAKQGGTSGGGRAALKPVSQDPLSALGEDD